MRGLSVCVLNTGPFSVFASASTADSGMRIQVRRTPTTRSIHSPESSSNFASANRLSFVSKWHGNELKRIVAVNKIDAFENNLVAIVAATKLMANPSGK